MSDLRFEYGDKTIQEFVLLFRSGQLNLDPAFQRKSVWTITNRRKLIDSIFKGYPLPSVFLYRNPTRAGKLVYDVIDGKQRLESILMFQGVGRFRDDEFSVKTRLDEDAPIEEWDWTELRRKRRAHTFAGYKLQTAEVSGGFGEVVDLFIRINSTGMKLSSAEQRHAKFFRTEFLKVAEALAERYGHWFVENRVLSGEQIGRMKHVELVCELLASVHTGRPLNKKTSLDDVIAGRTIEGWGLEKAREAFERTLRRVARMFPNLRATRFANSVDFYSLFMLVSEMDRSGLVLTRARRNAEAQRLLEWLSNGVTLVRQQVRQAKGARPNQQVFANYLLTIQGDTDSQATRERRAAILRGVLAGLFEQKDSRRAFSLEQRRLIWNSDDAKQCTHCSVPLTWNNFTIDHVKPYSLGGKTEPSNAALMCLSCNVRKGARSSPRKSGARRVASRLR
jgi:5-methylcytosine-specific restriction endonuclease McrA